MPYTLSHRLNPIIREYRRASSTAIDASLKPLMQEYLSTMERDLRAGGLRGAPASIATSFGGAWRPDEVVERPIYSVGSGPSMAPVAALTYAREPSSARSAGATSSSATRAARRSTSGSSRAARSARPPRRGSAAAGSATSRASARSTSSRSARAAARSSGSTPAACCASGRAAPGPTRARPATGAAALEPTVTDAAVVLGWIDPAYFLGGRLTLDAEAARRRSRQHIAEPLGLSARGGRARRR